MSNVIPFQFDTTQVRVIKDENGEPLFVASDVANALGYAKPENAIARHCKAATTTPKQGGGFMSVIPERDVYRLIMRSKLPSAEKFEEWVVGEVIPAIRKHGMYATPTTVESMLADPQSAIQMLQAFADEQSKRRTLEARVEADRPKVVFAESLEVAKSAILVREMAKLIQQATGYAIGQNRFYTWLRENGFLIRSHGTDYNMPTQRSTDMGIFKVQQGTRTANGETHITKTTKVTGKGQQYFINKFREMNQEAA